MVGTWRGVLVAGCSLALGVLAGFGSASEGLVSVGTLGEGPGVVVRTDSPRARIIPVAQKSARQKPKGKAKTAKDDAAESAKDAEQETAEQARLSSPERDKQLETVGRERWKKADPKGKPEATPGTRFFL